jgi:pimeloyl-ACP methyl ester carboxylesterase
VIDVPSIYGRYEGTVQEGATSIVGRWFSGPQSIALDLERVESVEIVRRPQDPVPPYPYEEREVRFRNEAAGITLAGTLTMPREAQAVPAVVLVTGSGSQNRNEEIMNHRPFLVLADYLTRQGIAVLRYDDRGVQDSGGDPTQATTRDFAEDALSAFLFLSAQAGVDPSKVGIVGHSEGGLVAPMVASEHPDVAFIVILAANGYRGDELLLQQSAAILRTSGATEAQIGQAASLNRSLYDVVLSEPDDAKAAARIGEILAGAGMSEDAIDAQVAMLLPPWFRFFLSYDPAEALRKTRCPVLALNGSLDVQVPADLNLAAIEKALREGGNTRVTTIKLEGLNHLFQHAKTGAVQEYAQIEETFAPEAMKIVADWILEQAAR